MAASGAKVLQLRSVEFARNHGVVLHVRSSFSPADGTWVIEEDERMLEKAMISGVTHTLEETLYWVEGVTAARLFAALAEGGVNVDTIVQTGEAEIVFSAPTDDASAVEEALERARRHLARARRPRQGQPHRRGHEEPSGRGGEDVLGARRREHRAADRDHVADQGRLPRPARGRRARGAGAAPRVRAAPARSGAAACRVAEGSASSAPPAPWAACLLEILARARLRRRRALRLRALGGDASSTGAVVEEATPEALAAGGRRRVLLRHRRLGAAASSPRTPCAAARSSSTSRPPGGWSRTCRSSCPR